MILKLIWRNLWRNRRRTLITMTSVTFSVVLAVFMQSLQKGTFDNLIRNVVAFHAGYIQVHQDGYWDEQVIENSFLHDPSMYNSIRQVKDVRGLVPRIEAYALASYGTRTRGCMVIGTLPEAEDRFTRLSSRLTTGVYFEAAKTNILVAQGLARKLEVSVGDTLVLIGQGFHGAMAAAKYRIGGILSFQAPAMNESMVYLPLPLAQAYLGAEGRLTSMVLDVSEPDRLYDIQSSIQHRIGNSYEVMNWKEMMPEIENHIKSDALSFYVFTGILYLIVAFGIFSTMLMMTAERKYEFGMLLAIGMKRMKLAVMLLGETLLISLMGTLSGLLLAFPAVWYVRAHPFRFSGANARAFESWGFEAVLLTTIDPGIFIRQSLIILIMAFLIGLYPVWHVRGVDPVRDMKK